jgi:hypothetical protein
MAVLLMNRQPSTVTIPAPDSEHIVILSELLTKSVSLMLVFEVADDAWATRLSPLHPYTIDWVRLLCIPAFNQTAHPSSTVQIALKFNRFNMAR